jgi:putative flippase GtrA
MKTFGLFILLFIVVLLATFNIWRNASIEEMIKMIMATQITYIMYRFVKEENE